MVKKHLNLGQYLLHEPELNTKWDLRIVYFLKPWIIGWQDKKANFFRRLQTPALFWKDLLLGEVLPLEMIPWFPSGKRDFAFLRTHTKGKEVGQHCALCVEDNAPGLKKGRRTWTDHAWCYVRCLQPVEETSAPLNFFSPYFFMLRFSCGPSSWYCCCCWCTHTGPLGTGYLQKVKRNTKNNNSPLRKILGHIKWNCRGMHNIS